MRREVSRILQLVVAVLANAVGDFAQSMRKEHVDAGRRQQLDALQKNGHSLTDSERVELARLDRFACLILDDIVVESNQ